MSANHVIGSNAWLRNLGTLIHGSTRERTFESVGLVVFFGVLVIVFASASPYFLTSGNYTAIAVQVALTGILAAAQTVVLISGNLDLSFMAVLALTGIVAEKVYLATGSFPVAVVAALGVGALAGGVNALIVVRGGVNALIATIGSQFMFRALCYVWLGSNQLPYLSGSSAFGYVGNGRVAGIPFPFVLMAAVFIVIWFMLKFTRFGSRVYAVGGSPMSARLVGVSVPRLQTIVFMLSGVAAGLGGVLETGLNGTATASAQLNQELLVFAAVIVGGTGLMGGRGTMLGTLLGVFVLGIATDGLNLVGANPYWEMFMSGLVMVVAMIIDERRRRRLTLGRSPWRSRRIRVPPATEASSGISRRDASSDPGREEAWS